MAPGGGPTPDIDGNEPFDVLVHKLAMCLIKTVDKPLTFEDFRTTNSHVLTPLAKYLTSEVHHPSLVGALLALKGHFTALETDTDQDVNAARGAACEAVALRFVNHLSDREIIDSLLYELASPKAATQDGGPQSATSIFESVLPSIEEDTPLLPGNTQGYFPQQGLGLSLDGHDGANPDFRGTSGSELALQYAGLNALEIAAVSEAKHFLSQKPIQRVINAIWNGEIIFWSSLRSDSTKRAQVYQRKSTDPYCRLRVPKYLKAFEVLFFLGFLIFYYMVLVQRPFHYVSVAEVFLYVWLAAFSYNELGEFWDAGMTFYLSDFWSMWDILLIVVGLAFFVTRMIGLSQGNNSIIDTSFDILSLEALFLVPRICSLLSLNPYYGTLIPCLKEMTKDFVKFLSLVVILYLGFLTTFSLLARGSFSFRQMSWILVKVFFGSSYLGFDVADKISPVLGPALMLVFVTMTNILLITSLISILSNSLTKVVTHARDEYLYVYSVYVLEASTSNRLTYFIPPLNLIPLILRPLRLVLSAEKLRSVRILLLKFSHLPFVLAIVLYENVSHYLTDQQSNSARSAATFSNTERPTSLKQHIRTNRLSTPQPLAAVNLKRSSMLVEEPQAMRTPRTQHSEDEPQEDMRSILARLCNQVDQLSKRIEQQEKGQQLQREH